MIKQISISSISTIPDANVEVQGGTSTPSSPAISETQRKLSFKLDERLHDFEKYSFQVSVYIYPFKSDEVIVSALGHKVLVECKQKKATLVDNGSKTSSAFWRNYFVPEEYDMLKLKYKIYDDGMLTLTVPRKDTSEHFKPSNIIYKMEL